MHGSLKALAWGAMLGLAGMLSGLPANGLDLRPAREVQSYGLAIAIRKDQRVVMSKPKLLATGVLAVLPLPLERTVPLLREVARQRFGETAWEDQERSDFYYWEKYYGPFPKRREEHLRELKAAAVTVDSYREIMYRSEHYNVWKILGWTRGYSVLSLWLLDGRAIFGSASTLIRLQRRDEAYAWIWSIHHFPIPLFGLQGEIFASGEEVSLVQDLAKATGVAVAFYPELNYSYSLLDSTPALIQAAQWLRSQP